MESTPPKQKTKRLNVLSEVQTLTCCNQNIIKNKSGWVLANLNKRTVRTHHATLIKTNNIS